MFASYSDVNLNFTIGDTRFDALNLIYEKFLRVVRAHSHGSQSYELHYIPEGYGRARIQGKIYEITPGTLYMTGPHIEHAQMPLPEDPMCEYCIYLKTEKRRRSHPPLHTETDVTTLFEETPFWFGPAAGTGPLIEGLFAELKQKEPGFEIQAESLLKQIVVSMTRHYRQAAAHPNPEPSPIGADKSAVIMEDSFFYEYHDLSLESLAGRLGLGTRQTERLLQKHFGKTFLQKKTEARMTDAALLLADSSRSITSIAEDLGYSSVEHFSTAFRRWFGIGPRKYRKEHIHDEFYEERPAEENDKK